MSYVTINGTALATYGLSIAPGTEGWMDGIRWNRSTVVMPGRTANEVSPVETATPRIVRLRGFMAPTSISDRSTKMDALVHALRGDLNIAFASDGSRHVTGQVRRITTTEQVPGYVNPKLVVTIELECVDPAKYTTATSTATFGTAGVAVALGTLPSRPTVTITGPGTDPILRYKAHGGATQGYMSFTITLASGSTLTVDMDRMRIRKTISGTETNAMDTLASGDFFELDPADASPATGSWPSLTLSAGAGSVSYNKAWQT
jgi:hypothetical protein